MTDAVRRLWLARRALIATGYFRPHEVGDDVAPRIVELWSFADRHIPLGEESLKAMAEIDEMLANDGVAPVIVSAG